MEELVAHLNNNPYGYYVGQEGIHIDHIRCIASFMPFHGLIQQATQVCELQQPAADARNRKYRKG